MEPSATVSSFHALRTNVKQALSLMQQGKGPFTQHPLLPEWQKIMGQFPADAFPAWLEQQARAWTECIIHIHEEWNSYGPKTKKDLQQVFGLDENGQFRVK